MMKRTTLRKGRRSVALVAIAGMVTVLGFGVSPAAADLPDPHLFLDYSTLDFIFTRTATEADAYGTIGTFAITDAGSTLDAILRDGTGSEIDRASIKHDTDFDISVTGNVFRNADGSYSLTDGTFDASDATGTTKILADFESSTVAMTGPPAFSNVFSIFGGLTTFGGGEGPVLVNGIDAKNWSFAGVSGDTDDPYDIGNDDLVAILDRNIASYDTGAMIDFTLGADFADLDDLFDSSSSIGGGDMKVTIVPTPSALALGAFGLGMVGWMRRRLG